MAGYAGRPLDRQCHFGRDHPTLFPSRDVAAGLADFFREPSLAAHRIAGEPKGSTALLPDFFRIILIHDSSHTNVGTHVNTNVGKMDSTNVGMAKFGDRVREERMARGWSYQELADRVTRATGITCPRVTIEKIEDRGAEKSKWSHGIASALNVDHEWLLTGKGNKKLERSIDRKLKLLPPDISELLHDQFDVLIENELEKRQRKDQ